MVNLFFLFFSNLLHNFCDYGFGSVFDGAQGNVHCTEISTQAVLDLVKNALENDKGLSEEESHVEIANSDIDLFNIDRSVVGQIEPSIPSGEIVLTLLINIGVVVFCMIYYNVHANCICLVCVVFCLVGFECCKNIVCSAFFEHCKNAVNVLVCKVARIIILGILIFFMRFSSTVKMQ